MEYSLWYLVSNEFIQYVLIFQCKDFLKYVKKDFIKNHLCQIIFSIKNLTKLYDKLPGIILHQDNLLKCPFLKYHHTLTHTSESN